jgi:UDP-glucose 4-epimerase
MKYLITGGCGFIGSHISEALVKDGHEVVIFDDLSSGYERNISHFRSRVEFIKGDVRDVNTLDRAVRGMDYVFHEAALVSVFDSVERPADNNAINITGTLNVLSAARAHRVKRVVMASSAAAYGNEPALPKNEAMRPAPESPYALAKITGEYYMHVFHSLYGLETVALRYFNVYGPRQDPSSMYSGVISKFSDVLKKGGSPVIFGDGAQSRDFVYVKDVVKANLLAMHSEKAGKGDVFNVATGKGVSLLELLGAMCKLFGGNAEPVFKAARAGDIRHSLADIARARDVLGYSPQYSLENGLKELFNQSF